VFLIETSTCVSLLRRRLPRVAERLTGVSPDALGISAISAAELYHGVGQSNFGDAELGRVRELLEILTVLDFGTNAAISYGIVRRMLEARGLVIGQFDMLIAGHALSVGATLVTHNTREFRRVPGLVVEDWGA
jgi:tRNA(fMet)-specific endonuclease VapC